MFQNILKGKTIVCTNKKSTQTEQDSGNWTGRQTRLHVLRFLWKTAGNSQEKAQCDADLNTEQDDKNVKTLNMDVFNGHRLDVVKVNRSSVPKEKKETSKQNERLRNLGLRAGQ